MNSVALCTLSICTGEAGIELGVDIAHTAFGELAGSGVVEPICYVEREAYAAANLARLVEAGALPDAPFWSDVRTLCDAGFRAFMEGVSLDLLCGGYPCQPFSIAGRQRGADDPRHLWPAIAEAIGAYRPTVCFFENVPAHLGLGYPEVRADLRAMGYGVTEGLFSAGELGCGHRRQRLFILALANALPTAILDATAGRGDKEDRAAFAGSSNAPFPANPKDIGSWVETVKARPELAPAIEPGLCRLADGIPLRLDAHRSHRLRLHGNAVVPLVAAYAWVFLWADLLYGTGNE